MSSVGGSSISSLTLRASCCSNSKHTCSLGASSRFSPSSSILTPNVAHPHAIQIAYFLRSQKLRVENHNLNLRQLENCQGKRQFSPSCCTFEYMFSHTFYKHPLTSRKTRSALRKDAPTQITFSRGLIRCVGAVANSERVKTCFRDSNRILRRAEKLTTTSHNSTTLPSIYLSNGKQAVSQSVVGRIRRCWKGMCRDLPTSFASLFTRDLTHSFSCCSLQHNHLNNVFSHICTLSHIMLELNTNLLIQYPCHSLLYTKVTNRLLSRPFPITDAFLSRSPSILHSLSRVQQ